MVNYPLFRFLYRVVFYTFCGAFIISSLLIPSYLRSLPELFLWHTEELTSEFSTDKGIASFEDFLKLEKGLFKELETKITKPVSDSPQSRINRFSEDSISYPGGTAGKNWNRTYILETDSPERSILLLHGLSDSPYSLRSIGQQLHGRGSLVLGLRLPGHGTIPSGLLDTSWEDMAEAVMLAMNYLQKENPGKPVYIIGYSTGAALALHYALLSLTESNLMKPAGLIFISPAIGVSKVAALAQFKEKVSKFPGFEKMGWTDILPEYNPYKYNSFTANSGNQVYQLTRSIQKDLAIVRKQGGVDGLPPILSFQSIVDATVSTPALVDNLFQQLTRPGHEIVIFDLNRSVDLDPLVKKDPVPSVHRLLDTTNVNFTVSFVTNHEHGSEVFIHRKRAGSSTIETKNLALSWPQGVYSLSHIALPFSENDPLYGKRDPSSEALNLGDIPLRGERGLLTISPNEIIRLKWNPFYPFMEEKIVNFIDMKE